MGRVAFLSSTDITGSNTGFWLAPDIRVRLSLNHIGGAHLLWIREI